MDPESITFDYKKAAKVTKRAPRGVQEAQMKPRRPKWSPGGPNEAQEAQMEPRGPKWSSGGPKWSPGGPNGAQEAQTLGPNPSSIA